MLSEKTGLKKQQGVVLAFALVILVVLTIIGIATMSSTVMQERMAGIFKTQTEVFGEASSGVSQALDYYYGQIDGILKTSRANDDGQICGYVHNKDDDDWVWGDETGALFDVFETKDNRRIERQLYCCQSWVQVDDPDPDPDLGTICLEDPSRLFVLNRGVLSDGADGTLAQREIEIQLAEAAPEDPTCAICVAGPVGSVAAPTSGAFRVDGACGPAIATENPVDAAKIIGSIGDKNISNYDGGVVAGNLGAPWNDPVALAEFVFWAKLGIPDANYYGDITDNGNTAYGTETDPQITYFDGDVSMGGNISGAGIMIVRGTLNWNGTPDFQGLLIGLGGGFSVGGGGRGGNPEGSFVATNLVAAEVGADLRDIGREVLRYPVAEVADPDNADDKIVLLDEEGRPVLLASDGTQVVFKEGQFYRYPDDTVLGVSGTVGQEDITLDGTSILSYSQPGDPLPRDRFGRLIPDFVGVDNWPPDSYGYDPNEWRWIPNSTIFSTSPTDLEWKGGGKQAFKYDCKELQRVRHRLLCVDKNSSANADPDLPADFDYKNPSPTVCEHNIAAEPYNQNVIEDLSKSEPNHFSWHAWQPKCDCLGISGDSDIIITGWRENIGWRDEAFAGCAALSKAVRCPDAP